MKLEKPIVIPKNKIKLFTGQIKKATSRESFSVALANLGMALDITDDGYVISEFSFSGSLRIAEALNGCIDYAILYSDDRDCLQIIKDGQN